MNFFRVRSLVLITALVALGIKPARAEVEAPVVANLLQAMPATHPRLFLSAGGEVQLKQQIAANPVMRRLQDEILREADRELASRPVERQLVGRRLLDKSRTALSRVLHLGMAWRLTGERKYLERARAELVAVAQFSDWNPSHYLDVAEMTTAVGIGYDWMSGLS